MNTLRLEFIIERMSSIYLHIPFCRKVCGYCDFYKSANTKLMEPVLDAMMAEIVEQRSFLNNQTLSTIYFGGGTPSLLSPPQVGMFLQKISETYDVSGLTEVTLEANPDDLTSDYLRELRSVGVNRLSIGVQSFDDETLRFMNRRHDAKQALSAIEQARRAGFDNIAIDLIFGVSGFGGDKLKRSLEIVDDIKVEHIAAYHLTIEPNTLFARLLERGQFAIVEEEVSEREYEMVRVALMKSGYNQYEISNYALGGKESRHNSAYWSGDEYLGIGAGAHSFSGMTRRWSEGALERYLKGGAGRYEVEILNLEQRRNEVVMTSLRRAEGICLAEFERLFGDDAVKRLLGDSERSVEMGDLLLENGKLKIPTARFLRSDLIIEQLFNIDKV